MAPAAKPATKPRAKTPSLAVKDVVAKKEGGSTPRKAKKKGKEGLLDSVLARPPLPWCPYGPARGSSEAVLACPLPYGSPLPGCLLAGSRAKTCVSDS